MAHRIDGRKLSRKTGPRKALYKNLTVSVLRYEQIKTTEAKAKEIRGQVEQIITLAKRRRPVGAPADRRASCPNEPLVVDKLINEIAPKYADRTSGYTRIVQLGQRLGDAAPDGPDRAGLTSSTTWDPRARDEDRPRGRLRSLSAHGWNTTERTSPASRSNLESGRSRESSRRALARLRRPADRARSTAAGRTDAGVHATRTGDRIHLLGRTSATRSSVGRSMRSSRRTSRSATLSRVPDGFDPRYAARYREYRYTVWNGPRSPLRERYALGVRDPLDVAAMARAGSVLVGRHDFCAFGTTNRTSVRTVHAVRVARRGRVVTIDVAADAFLRGMVRRIVAVLIEVGLGRDGCDSGRCGAGRRAAGPRRGECPAARLVSASSRPRTAGAC